MMLSKVLSQTEPVAIEIMRISEENKRLHRECANMEMAAAQLKLECDALISSEYTMYERERNEVTRLEARVNELEKEISEMFRPTHSTFDEFGEAGDE